MQTLLNPNFEIGSASLSQPSITGLFDENKYSKTIDVPDDEFSISAFHLIVFRPLFL